MSSLLDPIVIGNKLRLRNRVVMGAMTRNRCVDDYKPGQSQITHYADRARDGTGLIINEGTFIDWTGCDWKYSPFLITRDHAEAWRKVTDAVHKVGGTIFFQAWHAGRCQHDGMPIMKEGGHRVVAPSAIPARAGKYRDLPGQPGHTQNIYAIEDVQEVVGLYRRSCRLAKDAGFDGVELLAQGGYLPQQFLNSRANKRTDKYGGSVENRCRFILEVVDAIAEIFEGPEFICIKITPTDDLNDAQVQFDEMKEVYTCLIKELVKRGVGIINLSRRGTEIKHATGDFFGQHTRPEGFPLPENYDPVLDFGPLVKFPGSTTKYMTNHDYTVEEADNLLKAGKIDMISFGRPFIYNPDLVSRIRYGIPFQRNDRGPTVYYGPGKTVDENYNDWPTATTEQAYLSMLKAGKGAEP